MSEHLDGADLALRRWSAEDRLIRHARSLTGICDLDPSLVERMESAALHSDQAALERAAAEMLEAIAES